ncbi:multidrug transporter MatE [Sesbania bispinosa]|nr:multidrug transporter MatE [Sesbania bispinosa]
MGCLIRVKEILLSPLVLKRLQIRLSSSMSSRYTEGLVLVAVFRLVTVFSGAVGDVLSCQACHQLVGDNVLRYNAMLLIFSEALYKCRVLWMRMVSFRY